MKKKFLNKDLLNECREIYNYVGTSGLLYKNIDKTLYNRLYRNGIKLSDVITQLGLDAEFKKMKLFGIGIK